jgi:hypothetical protein
MAGLGLSWDEAPQSSDSGDTPPQSANPSLGLSWEGEAQVPTQKTTTTQQQASPSVATPKKRKATTSDYLAAGGWGAIATIPQMAAGALHSFFTDKNKGGAVHTAAKIVEGATEPQHSAYAMMNPNVDFSDPGFKENAAFLAGMVGADALMATTGVGTPGAVANLPVAAVKAATLSKQAVRGAAKAIGDIPKAFGSDIAAAGKYLSKLSDLGISGAAKDVGSKALQFGALSALKGGTLGLGAAGGAGAVELAKKLGLDEKIGQISSSPEEAQDLQTLAHTAVGLGGGALAGKASSFTSNNLVPGITDIAKRRTQGQVPTASEVGTAEMVKDVLSDPSVSDVVNNSALMTTPRARGEAPLDKTQPTVPEFNPEVELQRKLGVDFKPLPEADHPEVVLNSQTDVHSAVKNAYNMSNRMYEENKKIFGDDRIEISPDAIKKLQEMRKIRKEAEDKAGNELSEVAVPEAKASISYFFDRFLEPLLSSAYSEGDTPIPATATFADLQEAKTYANAMFRSLNLTKSAAPTIKTLESVFDTINQQIYNHVVKKQKEGVYPEGVIERQKAADELYASKKDAELLSDSMVVPKSNLTEPIDKKVERTENIINKFKDGTLATALEYLTRKMHDTKQHDPSYSNEAETNAEITNKMFDIGKSIAGENSQLLDYFNRVKKRQGAIEYYNKVDSPRFIDMPDGLSIGSLRHVEPYLLHGKIDSGKLIDDITTGSDKAKSFLREVNNLGSLDKISPTINSLIDEKIKSMFKQGFSKGSETTSDLSKIISDLSNMHDSMKSLSDSDYGDVVNPKNKQTLQAAKALNEVVKSSDFDPKKISQIEETVKNLKKIDNTDNPAIKAAEILDRLGKAQEKISTVSKNLPDVKKTKIRDWMENSVMKPFVKFLNDIHFSEKTKQQRNQLGEIEAGIKTPRGRDLIKDKIYDAEKTIDIANKIKREALLKSTVAGGFAGEKDVAPAIPQISQEEMLKMKLRNEANQALAKRLSGAL